MHSFFHSNTIRQEMINGKETREEKHVTIENGKGTKTVKHIENGKTVRNATVPLTIKEIENATNRVFMPNFWQNCKPGNNCANTKKNKNNNSKKNYASKKRTRKHRRQ